MARKLKTFQTSMGFFDLAIAAPSMKAALDAWDTTANLFHRGLARETDDRAIVKATLAKPGIILRRPVGTIGAFKVDAKLPTRLPTEKATPKRAKPAESRSRSKSNAKSQKAAAAYEREERKRERIDRQEKAAARQQRGAAIAKVEAEIEAARRNHEECLDGLDAKRETIEKLFLTEERYWDKERHRLNKKLRRARK